MRKVLFCIILGLVSCFMAGQRQAQHVLSVGDVVHQDLKLFDSTNSEVNLQVPSDRNLLFYRFRGYNWFTDTRDSIELAESIFRTILATAPGLKKLRVICYGYNLDNFLTSKGKPTFKADSNYTVEYYFLNNRSASPIINGGKLSLFNKEGKVLATSPYLSNFKFEYKPSRLQVFRAKLMTEKNGAKTPLANARVYFFGRNQRDTISSATTNKYGDFEINTPDDQGSSTLNVQPAEKNIKTVILATQEGRELATFEKTENGFQYRFIHAEVTKLTEMPEPDDISLMVKDFARDNKKEFNKTEDINYELARYELIEASKLKLDKLGKVLMENQAIRLEVISHTDSQGDDGVNMQLSEKRSAAVVSYLIFIGVGKTRLKAVGKGETQIRNRCQNGVDCSDSEHRYNRRTEFRFMKD